MMAANLWTRISMRAVTALIAALLLALSPVVSAAKSQSGGVVDPSTILGFGPRAGAMGNAYMALGDDATMAFWNPAALDMNRRKEIFGQYSQAFFDNTSYNMLAYKHPLGRFGTLGGGLILEGVDDLTRRDVNAANIGTFNVSKMNLMFSYGKQMTHGFYLGTSLHILRQQIAEYSGVGYGLDVAALYRFTNRYVEYSRGYLKLAREQMSQDAERDYTLGMRAYETGKYGEALDYFRKAAETDPSDKAAKRMMLLTAQKDRSLAERLKNNPPMNGHTTMAEFLKTHSASGDRLKTLQAWFDEGVKLYDAGKIKEAIPFFEAVIRHARSDYLTDRLSLGLNLQNLLEPSIKLKSTADNIPLNIKLGTSYRITDWLSLAFDLDVPAKGAKRIHFGVEWKPIDWLALRAGLDNDEPAFGIGFRYQDLKVDYAFMPSGDLDKDFQRVGLSYEFGKSQGDLVSERIQRGLAMQSKKDYAAATKEWEQAEKLQPTNPLPRRYMKEGEADYQRNVTDPWAAAERHLSAGRLMEAQPIVTSVLSYDPAFVQAQDAMARITAGIPSYVESHFAAGYLKYLEGDDLSVVEEMNRVLYFRPGNASAEQYRNAARKRHGQVASRRALLDLHAEGMQAYRAGKWADGLARFQAVLRRDATHPTAGELIDQIAQFESLDYLPAEKIVEAEKFLSRAAAAFFDGAIDRAELLVSHALALNPGADDAKQLLNRIRARRNAELLEALRRGDRQMDAGAADLAMAEWKTVSDRDPQNLDVRKRYEANVDAFRNFVDASARSAARHAKAGEAPEAMLDYNRVLAVDPFNEQALAGRESVRPQIVSTLQSRYAEAERLYRRGELDHSLSILAELVALDPDLAQAKDLQAMAKQHFDQNIALVRVKRFYDEGYEFYRAGNFEQAVAAWQTVVSEKSALPEAERMSSDARVQITRTVAELERVRVETEVNDRLRAGDEYLSAGKSVEALEEFRKVQEIQPDRSGLQWRIDSARRVAGGLLSGWIEKGDQAIADGRRDDAQGYYQSVLGVDPENEAARAGIDRVLGLEPESEVEPVVEIPATAGVSAPAAPAKKVVRESPTAAVARLLARANQARLKAASAASLNRQDIYVSRLDRAVQQYRDVLKVDPSNEAATSALAEIRVELARAKKELRDRQAMDVQSYIYSGMGHYRSGRLQEAIADWNRVLAIDPGHAQAKEYIRRAEKKLDLTR